MFVTYFFVNRVIYFFCEKLNFDIMNIYDLIKLQDTWVDNIEENLYYYPENIEYWRYVKFKDVKDFFVEEGWNDNRSLGDCVWMHGNNPIKLSELKKFLKSDGRNINEFLSQCVDIAIENFLDSE